MKRVYEGFIALLLISFVIVLVGCNKDTTTVSNETAAVETQAQNMVQQTTLAQQVKEEATTIEAAPEESSTKQVVIVETPSITEQEVAIEQPAVVTEATPLPALAQLPASAQLPAIGQTVIAEQPAIPQTAVIDNTNGYNIYISQLAIDQVVYSQYVGLSQYKGMQVTAGKSFTDQYKEYYIAILTHTIVSGYTDEMKDIANSIFNSFQTEYEKRRAVDENISFNEFILGAYGFSSQGVYSNYVYAYAKAYLAEKMILTMIAKQENITVTQEEFSGVTAEIASYYGYSSYQELINIYGSKIHNEVGFSILTEKVIAFLLNSAVKL